MIRSYLWFFLLTASVFGNICSMEPAQTDITINRSTHLTFRRYYFISRLDKTMQLLFKIQSTHHLSFTRSLHPINFDISLFNDKRIIRSLKRIQETKNLKPLFMVWDDFVAYKSLEDDIFIEDFSKEIFLVTRTVFSSMHDHTADSDAVWLQDLTDATPNKTEEWLDVIDEITHALQKIIPHRMPDTTKIHHTPPLDLKSEASTNEIALRFYYIQRLNKAMQLLSIEQPTSVYKKLPYNPCMRSIGVTAMLRAMQESGTPEALHHTWGDVKEYKFIDNIRFIKEFVSVAFLTLRHLYMHPNASELLNIELNIESISVEEILHAIDIITDQVSHTSELYDNDTSNNWQDWIERYWWIVPTTLTIIAVRLIYHHYVHKSYGYYGHQTYGSGFGSGFFSSRESSVSFR